MRPRRRRPGPGRGRPGLQWPGQTQFRLEPSGGKPYGQSEENGEGEKEEDGGDGNVEMSDVSDMGPVLDYLNDATQQQEVQTSFAPPYAPPQPQVDFSQYPYQYQQSQAQAGPSQPQNQPRPQPLSPDPSQPLFMAYRLPSPPIPTPLPPTGTLSLSLPLPNIASQIMSYPRPPHRDPTDGRESRHDRRLLNTSPNTWWNSSPSQHRTNPTSDKCWRCWKQREAPKCDLQATGYPCTPCKENGRGGECRNGLPTREWEMEMLRRKDMGEELVGRSPILRGRGGGRWRRGGGSGSLRGGGRGRGRGRGNGRGKGREVVAFDDDEEEKEEDEDCDGDGDDDDDVPYQGPPNRAGSTRRPGLRPRRAPPQTNDTEDFEIKILANGQRIRVESAASVQRRMKRLRSDDGDEDDDDDDGHAASVQHREKVRRSSSLNNRNNARPCDRCMRMDLNCPGERPCFLCLMSGSTCTKSCTNLPYIAAATPPFVNSTIESPPAPRARRRFFTPPENEDLYGASPVPPAQGMNFDDSFGNGDTYQGLPPQSTPAQPEDEMLFLKQKVATKISIPLHRRSAKLNHNSKHNQHNNTIPGPPLKTTY
ncbi:hypothetical protein ONS96_010688 [Cadophora gregata f. sp. sojae]|nr:hypothetical protein ONS96_010688 [Cadophora gregata f. sp. sojae]